MRFRLRVNLTACIAAIFILAGYTNLGAQTIAKKEHHVYVINDSTSEALIMVERTINSMNWGPDSLYAQSYFCFGPKCWGIETNESPYETVAACITDQTFIAIFKIKDSIAINDTSSITYCFNEINNPSDKKCVTFIVSLNSPALVHEDTIVFGSGCPVPSVGSDLFNGQSISIYPNPARDWITVEYSIIEKSENTWFMLRNMLGRTALKMKLYGTSGKIKVPSGDLNPGVYFYSLMVDDIATLTNKLIIDN